LPGCRLHPFHFPDRLPKRTSRVGSVIAIACRPINCGTCSVRARGRTASRREQAISHGTGESRSVPDVLKRKHALTLVSAATLQALTEKHTSLPRPAASGPVRLAVVAVQRRLGGRRETATNGCGCLHGKGALHLDAPFRCGNLTFCRLRRVCRPVFCSAGLARRASGSGALAGSTYGQ
jgi:hypothetical protein